MKGLLMKDLLNLKQTIRIWALLLALFIVIGFAQQSPVYISSMLTVMVLLLPVNALAYDENCKWDAYALTMPVTRRDLALSKYLLALVGAGAMALLSAVCALMMGATPDEVFSTIGLLLAAGLCMISILLPLLFRFGVQKGRMVMIVVVLLAAALLGTVYSSLLAVACINFKADQTIVGTALNMLGTAGATVIVKAINTAANPDDVSSIIQYAGAKKAFVVNIGSFEFSWFMLVTLLLLIGAYVVLYKTRFGLRLMACGEHPQAADSVGINVYKMRWAGVLISGMLGGLGGIVFITAGVSEWRFEYGVAGFGFLALAVMIFGQWKPTRIALAALLFGLFRALSNVYAGFDFLKDMNIPGPVYNMMPYIISLVVLAFTSKKSRAPKAEGIPYDKGQR